MSTLCKKIEIANQHMFTLSYPLGNVYEHKHNFNIGNHPIF